MRFRRNSLDHQPRRASRPGRPDFIGLPRWAVTAGLAAVIVASLVGVAMASVLKGAQTPTGASKQRVAGSAVGAAPHRPTGRIRPAAFPPAGPSKTTSAQARAAQARAAQASGARAGAVRTAAGHSPARAGTGSKALRTSCRSVAHIGDSTSVDLISAADLPNPAQRLSARYASVGVSNLKVDASGGRSIVEEMPGQINGYGVANTWRGQGYRGCWVFALGTNDAANVSVGSAVGLMARIHQMMAVAHGEPVLWVNTRTLLTSGPWSNAHERAWDRTLAQALARYPNMRIFNWAATAQPGWFLPDGIHYNSYGCARRAWAIAHALARAFPLHGHSRGQIVR